MYLKELLIKETSPVDSDIRTVTFKNNLNLIVDQSDFLEGEKANGIGKTTVLKVIDLCLGAKEKRSLYYDNDTRVTNNVLKDYIAEKKVSAELKICDNLDEPYNEYVLSMDLFPNGKCFIDGERYNKKEYNIKLNSIFFSNSLNSPTFRQLIKMFVRVDVSGDNNKFLKFLDRATTIEYENIYNYLFELQSQDVSDSILRIKESLKEVANDIISHKKINNFISIDSIRQRLSVLESESKSLNEQIDVLIDSNKYKENEEQVQQIKFDYAKILDSIDKYEFKLNRINTILEEAREEQSVSLDNDSLKELYEDTTIHFGELEKTFEELLRFNSELLQNKISYFEAQTIKFKSKVEQLKHEQENMFKNYSGIIMLIEENKLEEYEQLQKRSEEVNEEKGKNVQILNTYNTLNEKNSTLKEELSELEKSLSTETDNLTKFNQFFSEYSKETNDEECFLFRTDEGFPFGIDNISRNFSTGTRKSVIAAFDLAYQSFKNEINKIGPNFVIHDVIESIDLAAMNAIVKIVNELNSQYIVAVLNDKLEGVEGVSDSDKVLILSESERLFKV